MTVLPRSEVNLLLHAFRCTLAASVERCGDFVLFDVNDVNGKSAMFKHSNLVRAAVAEALALSRGSVSA
jgi:hypothetical protein